MDHWDRYLAGQRAEKIAQQNRQIKAQSIRQRGEAKTINKMAKMSPKEYKRRYGATKKATTVAVVPAPQTQPSNSDWVFFSDAFKVQKITEFSSAFIQSLLEIEGSIFMFFIGYKDSVTPDKLSFSIKIPLSKSSLYKFFIM